MYRDQFGEIVCGYWGFKGKNKGLGQLGNGLMKGLVKKGIRVIWLK